MRKFIGAAVLAVAVLAPSYLQAGGGGPTVQELRGFCKEGQGTYQYCLGMALGLIYVFDINAQTDARYKACIPKSGTKSEQAVQAFKNWADDNPKEWQADGVWGMAAAILQTWPCK